MKIITRWIFKWYVSYVLSLPFLAEFTGKYLYNQQYCGIFKVKSRFGENGLNNYSIYKFQKGMEPSVRMGKLDQYACFKGRLMNFRIWTLNKYILWL